VDEVSRFYTAQGQSDGTHLALRWKGLVRYTVPRERAGQHACWRLFKPGRLEIPMRAMAGLPWLLGSVACVESENLTIIRKAIGKEAGLSSCRAGAPGPWSKDTILLLDKRTAKPLYLVKAGAGEAVDALLQNEADWLRSLREEPSLVDHIPGLVAHRSGKDLCFVVQSPVSGKLDFKLGKLQLDFLRKLQRYSLQPMRYEDSALYRTICSRLADLNGLLTEAWSIRIEKAMLKLKQSLSGSPVLFVSAHNDFTPWNVRLQDNVAYVFDWEYAAAERLPLFDPLHFALLPMALQRRPAVKIVQKMNEALQVCQDCFGNELCSHAQTQALAYLVNVCILYLWGARMEPGPHPVLESYADVIDHMCRI
jgi:hypothetical protein